MKTRDECVKTVQDTILCQQCFSLHILFWNLAELVIRDALSLARSIIHLFRRYSTLKSCASGDGESSRSKDDTFFICIPYLLNLFRTSSV